VAIRRRAPRGRSRPGQDRGRSAVLAAGNVPAATAGAAAPRPLLLLLVTSASGVPAPATAAARADEGEGRLGVARVVAYRPDASGNWGWAQVTVAGDRPEPEVVVTAHRPESWAALPARAGEE
jgi:hypothetical protein